MNEKRKHMKYLKIENNKGYFLRDKNKPTDWIEIDQIEKNDLLNLLDCAENDDFEMGVFSEDSIQHKAHQIIYKQLFEKFESFVANKKRFKDESEQVYKEALEKYQ